ncbi:MAG: hypothetical protein JSV08_10045 [Acidobacteriota bacterium]|nr:MAG: hypothetical protein JSV08_10045 [Acidobacteriota bacterium]
MARLARFITADWRGNRCPHRGHAASELPVGHTTPATAHPEQASAGAANPKPQSAQV